MAKKRLPRVPPRQRRYEEEEEEEEEKPPPRVSLLKRRYGGANKDDEPERPTKRRRRHPSVTTSKVDLPGHDRVRVVGPEERDQRPCEFKGCTAASFYRSNRTYYCKEHRCQHCLHVRRRDRKCCSTCIDPRKRPGGRVADLDSDSDCA